YGHGTGIDEFPGRGRRERSRSFGPMPDGRAPVQPPDRVTGGLMSASVPQALSQQAAPAWPFPHVRKVGTTVYVGLQTMPPLRAGEGASGIEEDTQHAFRSLVAALESQGLTMGDLMKLHTYSPYKGYC